MSTLLMRALARGLLVAMLLAVLAPAISRTLEGLRGVGDWVEVCTSQGTRWVHGSREGTGERSVAPESVLKGLDACGHCALMAERFAPLQPTWPQGPRVDGAWGVPQQPVAHLHTLTAPSPGARDPPLLS